MQKWDYPFLSRQPSFAAGDLLVHVARSVVELGSLISENGTGAVGQAPYISEYKRHPVGCHLFLKAYLANRSVIFGDAWITSRTSGKSVIYLVWLATRLFLVP
jgi:hypothetical protein